MPRLYLVRHGRIAGSGGADPGLADAGRVQAKAIAAVLAPKGPLAILTSPFRRARETAAPLAHLWSVTPDTDARVGEIPLPPDSKFRSHSEWLQYARTRRWPEMHDALRSWRHRALQAVLEIRRDTVVVSHFVCINVAVGHALRDDRVTCFQPENCSCTVLDSDGSDLRVIELGAEGPESVVLVSPDPAVPPQVKPSWRAAMSSIATGTGLADIYKEYGRPDIHVGAGEDESPYIPWKENVYIRHLAFDVRTNTVVNVLWVAKGGILGRHRHRGPVAACVLEGSWRYLEYDWVARAGSYVHESPGVIHTLVSDDPKGMKTMFWVNGAVEFYDEADNLLETLDVFWFIDHYLSYCREHGLKINPKLWM